jgi:hypothetical protein
MGGTDSNGNYVNGMEVFDSKTKEITKLLDDQNKWLQMPIANMAADGYQSCAVPLNDISAFIVTGGQ